MSVKPRALAKAASARLRRIHGEAEAKGLEAGSERWNSFVDRELEAVRRHEEAAVRYRKVWDRALPASPSHPYLASKGVTHAEGLRQLGERLLIPLKSLEPGAPLMNIQSVYPDGRKLFGRGGRTKETRTTINHRAFRKGGVLHICEGWCTAWSVSAATGGAVVVAFSAGNLEPIALAMRAKYPGATIILCADNDRWSGAGDLRNPGVTMARRAAEAAAALVAIPDFESLDGRPTDFNDLMIREGEDAVRRWLNPSMAQHARTLAGPEPVASASPVMDGPEIEPPPDSGPPEMGEIEGPTPWLDRAPFRCLGYDHGTYFYLPEGTGQITGLTAAQHDRKTLLPLARLSYWEQEFPARNGVSWSTAADALLRSSERAGVFRPERLRGRGCWPEKMPTGEAGILVHLGDRLLAPGSRRYESPERFTSPTRFMYERQHHLAGPSTDPLDLTDARRVLETFQDLLWRDPASAYLAAGWTVLAPVCGALGWRPHIWLTGERGCGKSTVLSRLITPLLADMVLDVVGQSTEAGLRQELRADALAVVFDEAEEDETAGRRIQAVLALARQASSETGARTLKGTVQGSPLQFRIRSMFCLASIGGAVHQESDRSRISLLQLRGASQVSREERRDHWRLLAPKLDEITTELGRSLIARTLRLLRSGMLPETMRVFRQSAATVLGEARAGDQYGTLYAGAWTLLADDPPGSDEARELLSAEDLETYQQDAVPEGRKALDMLLQQVERLDTPNGPRSLAVGQLVDICCGRVGEVSVEIADARLRQIGIRVEVEDGAYVLLIANSSDWMRRVLQGTLYARGIRTVLLTLPGVEPGDQIRFHPGLKSRTVRVPYSLLD